MVNFLGSRYDDIGVIEAVSLYVDVVTCQFIDFLVLAVHFVVVTEIVPPMLIFFMAEAFDGCQVETFQWLTLIFV